VKKIESSYEKIPATLYEDEVLVKSRVVVLVQLYRRYLERRRGG
jgi:hypothetical protein